MGDEMKKRMLFVALLIAASVTVGGAQQGSAPVVSLSQLQREAAAVQGATLPAAPTASTSPTTPVASTAPSQTVAINAGATMAPVTVRTADQLGQAVDGA